jgi:hypothetical protein
MTLNAPDSAQKPRSSGPPSVEGNQPTIIRILRETLAYARHRDYTGWDYGDGMSSKIRQALPVDNKWVNIAFQETIKRSPVNVRPLFLVEQRRSYQGTALFAMTNLNFHRLKTDIDYGRDVGGETDYLDEARELLEWLIDNQSTGYSGFCGGHKHQLQHLDGRGMPNDPDVVSTSYAVKALLSGADLDSRYPDIARTAADFVFDELNYREVDGGDGAIINYHMNHSEEYYTINAGALGARLLIELYDYFGDELFRERATKILDHVARLQTDIGGWHYREPSDASHLSMDSHHNGFVIECFQQYQSLTGTSRYQDTIDRALTFYRDLFDPDGTPHFDESSAYPRDIHAAAQGILVFTYAGDLKFAERILRWSLDNLYAGGGQFYYRKHRFYTKRITLMRWCQAWMAYAMSEYLTAQRLSGTPDQSVEIG